MDKKWYQTIASSEFDGEKWVLGQDSPRSSLDEKIQQAMIELRYTVFEAVQIFNHHSPSAAHITILMMEGELEQNSDYEERGNIRGLMLLRYATKVRLVLEYPNLVMSLLETQSFRHQEIASTQLAAIEDELGRVVWSLPSGPIWDVEQLVKNAIKELVKSSSPQKF
ncbi:MAG: hypothetical protein OXC40_04945 [Proteobacteria bacterium]|nr:hypothetical protein [Pseudomonadota bacterium]